MSSIKEHTGRPDAPPPAAQGTYALVLQCASEARVQVGRLGLVAVVRGYYLYIGSAFGPGGLRARLLRHCRVPKTKHWHIDYLRELASLRDAWYCRAPLRLEHLWAQALSDLPGVTAVTGFGCSDCACKAHLFHAPSAPETAIVKAPAGAELETWICSGRAEPIDGNWVAENRNRP